MAQLVYAAPPKRTGLATALGIVSIIIGGLAVLMSLWNIVSMLAFTSVANVQLQPAPPVQGVGITLPNSPANAPATTQLTTLPSTQPATLPATQPAKLPAAPLAAQAAFNPFAAVSGGWIATSVLLSLASLALAGMLIVAGIGAVRLRPWSLRLHVWWALLKIPIAIAVNVVGAFISMQVFASMQNTAATPGNAVFTSGAMNYFAILGAVFNLLVAIAYPVAVLIATRFRAVREPLLGSGNRTESVPDN
ncbi:MAG: hypothetical protein AAGK78_09115 [Planctomycetota bacterium]